MLVATHCALKVEREVLQNSISRVEHECVDAREGLAGSLKGLDALSLDDASLEYVDAGLDGVQLHESTMSKLIVLNQVKGRGVQSVYIADRTEQLLDKTEVLTH